MAIIECRSAQPNVPSVMVEIAGITDDQVSQAGRMLNAYLRAENQISDAIAKSFADITTLCPQANPSDLWLQVIYRHLLIEGWSDSRWKRVSGFALERALSLIYAPRLAKYDLRMVTLPSKDVEDALARSSIAIAPSKADLLLQARLDGEWMLFGIAHVKASIAERIQDDVPASIETMNAGLASVILTMDAKSYPPPHGNCVNYGELGGRSVGKEQRRIKRDYVEVNGQFDGLFSFNLRTPESPTKTASGKRIHALSFNDPQPDKLVRFLRDYWKTFLESR